MSSLSVDRTLEVFAPSPEALVGQILQKAQLETVYSTSSHPNLAYPFSARLRVAGAELPLTGFGFSKAESLSVLRCGLLAQLETFSAVISTRSTDLLPDGRDRFRASFSLSQLAQRLISLSAMSYEPSLSCSALSTPIACGYSPTVADAKDPGMSAEPVEPGLPTSPSSSPPAFPMPFVFSLQHPEILAQLLFGAYSNASKNVTFDGKPMPRWRDLGEVKNRWIRLAEFLADFSGYGEFPPSQRLSSLVPSVQSLPEGNLHPCPPGEECGSCSVCILRSLIDALEDYVQLHLDQCHREWDCSQSGSFLEVMSCDLPQCPLAYFGQLGHAEDPISFWEISCPGHLHRPVPLLRLLMAEFFGTDLSEVSPPSVP